MRRTIVASGPSSTATAARADGSAGGNSSLRPPPLFSPPLLLLLLGILSMPRAAECTVTTVGRPGGGDDASPSSTAMVRREYRSRPAGFGREFEYGVAYAARLQVAGGDPHLCGNATDEGEWEWEWEGEGEGGGEGDERGGRGRTEYHLGNVETPGDDGGGDWIRVVKPADGLPGESFSVARHPPAIHRRFPHSIVSHPSSPRTIATTPPNLRS
jgi:hypothetical protein